MQACTKRWMLALLFMAFSVAGLAQTTSWIGHDRNWARTYNWTNGIPTSTMDIIVGDANFIGFSQPTIPATATFRSVTVGGVRNAVVSFKSRTVHNVTIEPNGTLDMAKGTLTITGNWINNGGSYTYHPRSYEAFAGTAQVIGGTAATQFKNTTINAGAVVTFSTNFSTQNGLTVSGTLIPDEATHPRYTGSVSVTDGGILKVNANVYSTNYSANPVLQAGSGVEYSAQADQTISNFTYSSLIISGAGTKSITTALNALQSASSSIGNIYVLSGILDLRTFTANRGTSTAGGTLSVANGASLHIAGGTSGTTAFPANFATVSLSITSTVLYYGTGPQVVSPQTYGNLTFTSSSGATIKTLPAISFTIAGNLTSSVGSGSSVSYTAASNINILGSVNIGASTTFDGSSMTIGVGGNWVNNGTFNGSTGTVFYTGAGSTISGTGTHNFNNISFRASDITATSALLTVAGNLETTGEGSFRHLPGNLLTMTGAGKTIIGSGIILGNLSVPGTVTTTSTFTVRDNLSVAGSLSASAGNISMTGASKTISGSGTMAFHGLLIPGTVTTASSFSVSNALDISGSFLATAGTATFTGSATLNGTANLFNVVLHATTLILSTNSVLGVSNTFTITAGTLNVTSAIPNTVHFNGTVNQVIPSTTYHQLLLSNGNTKTAGGNITTNGVFTIGTNTTFDASTFTHTLNSHLVNNGSFTAGTSTVQFMGASDVTLTGATTFNILTLNKTTSVNVLTLLSNVNASIVNMTNGRMRTNTNTITITTTRNGSGTILGNIRRLHAFSAGVSYAFAHPDNTINFASLASVTSVTVSVKVASVPDFDFGSSINREYAIAIPSGTYNATLRLHYEDGELNGNTESALVLWSFNGTEWESNGKTAFNATSNFVELAGITNLVKRWTLANIPNVLRWNGSVSTEWHNAANWTIIQGVPGSTPTANDVVQIGQAAFTHHPTITTAASARNIEFGSFTSATLTMGTGGSLQVIGNIGGKWTTARRHTINVGARSINILGNLNLSNGTTGNAIDVVVSTGNITIAGSLTQSGGANLTYTGAGNLYIGEDYEYFSGTFSAGSSTVHYNGTDAQWIGGVNYNNLVINKTTGVANITAPLSVVNDIVISGGELEVNANLVIGRDLLINQSANIRCGAITIYIGGSLTNTGIFIPGSSTIEFNGTGAQSISLATFYNLAINKPTGNALFTGNIDVYGDFSILAGNIALGPYTTNRTTLGGRFTLAAGATLSVAAENNFPRNYSTYAIAPASTVTYLGTGNQTVLGITYGNLVFSNGGATPKTLIGTATVAGNLTINSGATFNSSSFSINLSGNWMNNGTFVPETGAVQFMGTGNTISGNTTFNRITIFGNYTITGSDVTINSLLNVTSTGTLNAGAGTATVRGDMINSGVLVSSGVTTFTGTVVQNIRLIGALVSTSTGVINFNGNVSPVFNSSSSPLFATLNINNTAGVNPSVNWRVLVAFNVNSGGIFNGGASTHTISGAFTNNGTVTSSGELIFNPSVARTITLSGTNFSSTGTVQFGGTAALTVAGTPTTLTNVVISNTVGVTTTVGWNVQGNFLIYNNGRFNAGARSYTVGGNFSSDGTLDGGTSTFTLTSASGILDGSTNTTFYDLVITGNIASKADFNVARNFTNNGTYDGSIGVLTMTGSEPSIIGGSATILPMSQLAIEKASGITATISKPLTTVANLQVRTGIFNTAGLSISQEMDGTIGLGVLTILEGGTLRIGGANSLPVFSAYELDTLSTVEYAGGAQNISAATSYGNLLLSASGDKTAASHLKILNNFTITAGNFKGGNYTDTLLGNWTMTGGSYDSTNNRIVLAGAGTQTITSTGGFLHLTLNKATGTAVLGSNITVAGTLNFLSGRIQTNTFILNAAGSITGASQNTGWVNGNLRKNITATGTNQERLFEVGGPSNYTPANVFFANVTTVGHLVVRVFTPDHPQLASSNFNSNRSVNRWWNITNNGIVFSNANITFNWVSTDIDAGSNTANFRVTRYNGSTWATQTIASPLATSIQATAVTSFGDFAVAEPIATTSWTGTTSRNWYTSTNWTAGVPLSSTDVVIPAAVPHHPEITTGTAVCQNLTINSGASLVVQAATIQVSGIITASNNFTASAGTLELNSIVAQTIPANVFTANTILNLTINNSANVALAGTLNLTGVLTVSNGSFNTGGFLTLKSSATATARVAPITSAAATPIVGNVTVERYIPGRRRYRIITSSVTTSTANTLSPGQEALSIWGNWQNQGNTTTPNIGTFITGGTSADGFDIQTNNTSLFTYNGATSSFVGHTSANGKNTKLTPLKAGVPYFMFVYGDRTNTLSTSNPKWTILRATGTLTTGDQTYTTSSATPLNPTVNGFTMLGNPFASPIDWATLPKTNIEGTYWGIDPNLAGTGGYVTVTTAGTTMLVAPYTGTIGLNQYIQPGQGFFVRTSGASPVLQIREQDKVGNHNPNAFRSNGDADLSLIALNLYYYSGTTKVLTDGTLVAFDKTGTIVPGSADAHKMQNSSEAIGVVNDGKYLSIHTRQEPVADDTVHLQTLRTTRAQYILEVFTKGMETAVVKPYLQDKFLNTVQPLSVVDTNIIVVNITTDAASSAPDRFKIIFKKDVTLPVVFTSVSAAASGTGSKVDWSVATEAEVVKYEVERSADGVAFAKAAEVLANPSLGGRYSWIDVTVLDKEKYYKVKAINKDGTYSYSRAVLVRPAKEQPSISIFPNPVQGQQINIAFNKIDRGSYTLSLVNSYGQQVYVQNFVYDGLSAAMPVHLPNKLAAGVYYVQIVNAKEPIVRQLLLVK
ncbi:hypothetical protein [Aridibaculum aurantiacum]|uniref:hypothetical protein n=1 Tax=Aridibaculum aurantiacum TaxID=2810307 RepID=UPI001A95B2EE|nr:hypothetical protein [Aridibaculum aurantiacum]